MRTTTSRRRTGRGRRRTESPGRSSLDFHAQDQSRSLLATRVRLGHPGPVAGPRSGPVAAPRSGPVAAPRSGPVAGLQFAPKPRRKQRATLARPTSSAFRPVFEQKVEADAAPHGRYRLFARYPSRRQRAILRSASTSAFRSRPRAMRALVGLGRSGPVAAPRSGPVAGPRSSPVAAPRSGPVAAPRSGPVAAPRSGPVAGPRSSPVAAPRSGPVAGPRSGPVAGLQFAPKPRRKQRATLARPTSSAFRPLFEQKVEADAAPHGRYRLFARYPSRRQRAILRSASTSAFRSRPRAMRALVGLTALAGLARSGPVAAPRSSPVAAPRSGPVAAPRSSPVAASRSGPVAASRSGPVGLGQFRTAPRHGNPG